MKADKLFSHWEQVHEDTLATLTRFSDDDLAYEAFPGMMTVGDIARHIADAEEGWFRLVVTGERDAWPEDYTAEQYPTREAIRALLVAVHDRTQAYLATVDEDALDRVIDMPWGGRASLRWIIWHVLEHEIHHRGELSLILGLLGKEGLDV